MVLLVIAALVLFAAGVTLVLRGATATESSGTSETISQIERSYGFAAAPSALQGLPYLAQAWLCRRVAFENVGGFDARLPAEEDFELGTRLRRAGWSLIAISELAGIHHCAPRPSLAELGRRWRNGMFAGPGLALRHAWGGASFGELLARQRLYFFERKRRRLR